MKKPLLKNSNETKEFNIDSNTIDQILEAFIKNQTIKIDRNDQSVNLLEMNNQIKLWY